MLVESNLRKDSQLIKFKRRSLIFIKLSFTEMCDLKLSGFHRFDKIVLIH